MNIKKKLLILPNVFFALTIFSADEYELTSLESTVIRMKKDSGNVLWDNREYTYHALTNTHVLGENGHCEHVPDKNSKITLLQGGQEKVFDAYPSSIIKAMLLSKDAKKLFVGFWDDCMTQFWDLEKSESANLAIRGKKTWPEVLAFDEQQLLAVGYQNHEGQGDVQVWDVQNKKIKYSFDKLGQVHSLAFSGCADKLVASRWGCITLWNMCDGAQLQSFVPFGRDQCTVFFDNAAEHLFVVGSNKIEKRKIAPDMSQSSQLLFKDPKYISNEFTPERDYAHLDIISGVANYSCELLVSADCEGMLKFWNSQDGSLIGTQDIRFLRDHDELRAIGFTNPAHLDELGSIDFTSLDCLDRLEAIYFDSQDHLVVVIARRAPCTKIIKMFDISLLLAKFLKDNQAASN